MIWLTIVGIVIVLVVVRRQVWKRRLREYRFSVKNTGMYENRWRWAVYSTGDDQAEIQYGRSHTEFGAKWTARGAAKAAWKRKRRSDSDDHEKDMRF